MGSKPYRVSSSLTVFRALALLQSSVYVTQVRGEGSLPSVTICSAGYASEAGGEAQPLPGDQPARLSGIHHFGAKIDLIVACSPLKAQCFLFRMAFFWEVSRCTTAPTIFPCERMRPLWVPCASCTMPNRESMAATVIQVRETVTEGFHPPRLSGTHRLGAQADFTLGLVPWMTHP